MSPEPLPVLPRPLADPAYLYRLRQRALIRLREEEDAHTGRRVTRRWSLQRLGVLSTVLAPSLRLLLHGHAAFAEAPAGMRTSAPQYGVPGLPGNPNPVPHLPRTPASVEEARSPEVWKDSWAKVVVPGGSDGWADSDGVRDKTVYLQLASGDAVSLAAISDTRRGNSYIVLGAQAFYVADDTGFHGCVIRDRELILSGSLFQRPTPPDGDAGVIREFGAQMDDKKLTKETAASKAIHISLLEGVPGKFWDPRERDPWITNLRLNDSILEVHLMVYQAGGTFTIDLKKKKLVKFVDDASGGKWYGRKP